MWNLFYRANVNGVQFARLYVGFENNESSVVFTNSSWFHCSNLDFYRL